jgi:hypothetical protein
LRMLTALGSFVPRLAFPAGTHETARAFPKHDLE